MEKYSLAMEIQRIISLLKQTFEKDAWHGPSVKEALDGISAGQASKKLENTHSIIELVGHMTAWRRYVVKKLEGDPAYAVSDEMNFPQTFDWAHAVAQLEDSQSELLAALEKTSDAKLDQPVPGLTSDRTYYQLLHGIIHHDLYHAGQILLIKRATQ